MDIKYILDDAKANRRGITKGIGNLLMYFADTSLRVEQNLRLLKNNERARDVLVNRLREGAGATSLTVDNILTAIESALDTGGLFTFKVNGFPICDLVKGKDVVELEVSMHENYFIVEATKASLMPSLRGGFRNKDQRFNDQVATEKLKWQNWFESELNKDFHPADKTRKIVMEV